MGRILLIALAAALGCAAPRHTGLLKTAAKKQNFLFGAAVGHRSLRDDPSYRRLLAREFQVLVPEYVLKMAVTQPRRGRWDFYEFDRLLDFAAHEGLKVRGHTLVWHKSLPEWLTKGGLPPEELASVLERHIFETLTHTNERYPGTLLAWDVVNEPLDHDGGPRRSIFSRIGDSPYAYVELALKAARAADENARLFLNEYDVSQVNAKSDALYALAKSLLDKGIPLDGIGLQTHIKLDQPPDLESVRRNMRRFAALGLEIHITELDVAIKAEPKSVTSDDLSAQAEVYRAVAALCLEEKACTAMVTWGVGDRSTTSRGYSSPLLFDEKLRPKPAYNALIDVLSD